MRRTALAIIGGLFCLFCHSQVNLSITDSVQFFRIVHEFSRRDTIKTRMVYDAAKQTWSYETRDISINTFDSLFKPIYGKVMLGNSDLVNQGSAYALTVNQFESKFTINYNWSRDKKNIGGVYYNAGFAASSSSKVVPIFSKDEWQQGFTLTFGITKSFRKIIFYDRGEDYDSKRRQALMLSLKETYQAFDNDTLKHYRNKSLLNSLTDTVWKNKELLYDSLKAITYKGNKEFETAEIEYRKAGNLRTLDSAGIIHYTDSCFAAFETGYFRKYNYSFWWFNASLRPEYKGLSIYDTTAARLLGIKKKNYFRAGLDLTLNHASSKNRSLFLFQFGAGLKNTNYLEGRKAEDIEFLLQPVTSTAEVNKTDEAIVISDYEKYKKQFLMVSPLVGFNWFWGKKRIFGWEAFFSSKIGFHSDEIPFDNLFTFRTGPLLSTNGKDDLSKSTFGLIAQWEDVKFKSARFEDGFTFSIRIGIPFNF